MSPLLTQLVSTPQNSWRNAPIKWSHWLSSKSSREWREMTKPKMDEPLERLSRLEMQDISFSFFSTYIFFSSMCTHDYYCLDDKSSLLLPRLSSFCLFFHSNSKRQRRHDLTQKDFWERVWWITFKHWLSGNPSMMLSLSLSLFCLAFRSTRQRDKKAMLKRQQQLHSLIKAYVILELSSSDANEFPRSYVTRDT